MNDTLKESLSALLDGEANDLELRRILASDDPELRQEWAELNKAQQMRTDGQLPFANLDISQRVMAELADETLPAAGSGWKQALSGLAVAASVAAVVVFGTVGSDMLSNSAELSVADAASPSAGRVYPAQSAQVGNGGVPVNAQVQSAPLPAASPAMDEEAQKRFEMYLRRHTDRAVENNGQGVMSYARVVSQESE